MKCIVAWLCLAIVLNQLAFSETKFVGNFYFEKCKNGSVIEPPKCPEADPEGLPVYLPDPYDCEQFYECSNGIARCIKCAPGTVWDQENLICNHPAAVECSVFTTTQLVPTTTDNPEDWICDDVITGLIGHPTNCSIFYICDPGRNTCTIECPEGKCFNDITNTCENPASALELKKDILEAPRKASQYAVKRNAKSYQNDKKDNLAQAIQFVADTITDKLHIKTNEDDPCEALNFHIRNA